MSDYIYIYAERVEPSILSQLSGIFIFDFKERILHPAILKDGVLYHWTTRGFKKHTLTSDFIERVCLRFRDPLILPIEIKKDGLSIEREFRKEATTCIEPVVRTLGLNIQKPTFFKLMEEISKNGRCVFLSPIESGVRYHEIYSFEDVLRELSNRDGKKM